MNKIQLTESLPQALRYVPRHCLQPNHLRGWATTLMVFAQLALAIAFAAWTW